MSRTADVQWTRTFSNLGRVSAGMNDRADQIVRKAALDIEAGAKVRSPVDTGFLRASIQARRVGPAHWRVVVGADYGLYLEYGTARQRAQPYFHPAIRAVEPGFMAAWRTVAEV